MAGLSETTPFPKQQAKALPSQDYGATGYQAIPGPSVVTATAAFLVVVQPLPVQPLPKPRPHFVISRSHLPRERHLCPTSSCLPDTDYIPGLSIYALVCSIITLAGCCLLFVCAIPAFILAIISICNENVDQKKYAAWSIALSHTAIFSFFYAFCHHILHLSLYWLVNTHIYYKAYYKINCVRYMYVYGYSSSDCTS